MAFGFTPQPRTVQPAEHELNPVAEAVCNDKSQLNNFKMPGDVIPNMAVSYAGQQLTIGLAGAMASMQLGIPHDHPNMPPIMKHNTRYKAGEYYIAWGKANGRVKWLQDESFWYVPGFSRYVINDQGVLRNGHTGAVVSQNIYESEKLPLIADGKSQKPFPVRLGLFTAMAYSKLPEDFVDFTFGSTSHYNNLTLPNGNTAWQPVVPVTALSLVDQTLSHFKSSHEFLIQCIKEFDTLKLARPAIRKLRFGEVAPIGEYVVALGNITNADEFRSKMSGSNTGQSPVDQSSASSSYTPFDPDIKLSF